MAMCMPLEYFIFAILYLCIYRLTDGQVLTSSEENEIERYITSFLECKNVPGVGLAIVKNGEVYTRGFGFADIGEQRKFDADTISCGASTTKAMTATLLAILMTERKDKGVDMNWHTKIQDIPGINLEFSDNRITKEATLLDLLTHRTGVATVDFLLMSGYLDRITDRKTLSERIRYLPTVGSFREEWNYNNLMYMQVGYIAEVLGGAPFEDLLRDRILNKLNMTNAVFLPQIDEVNNLAMPYENINDSLLQSNMEAYKTKMLAPAGGICASPRDYAKWLQFLLRNGTTPDDRTLVDKELWEEMWEGRQYLGDWVENNDKYSLYKPFPVTFRGSSYATAWFRGNYRGHVMMWHTGGWFSYSAIAVVYRQKNLAYFITLNGPTPRPDSAMYPLSYLVSDVLLQEARWINTSVACSFPSPWKKRNTQGTATQTTSHNDYKEISTDASKSYTGKYGHKLYGNINVFYENKTLMVNLTYLLDASLMYDEDSDTFDLIPHGPLARLYATRKSHMQFTDKRGNTYHSVKLVYPTWAETYNFRRDIDFFADVTSGGFHVEKETGILFLILTSILMSA